MGEAFERTINVKTEVAFAFELMQQVVSGQVRIPRFSRRFVWRRDQMLELFESIKLGYPTGSILLWDAERAMGNIDRRATYVLDGQQRLSTLVGVLLRGNAPMADDEDQDRWCVYFDLESRQFAHLSPQRAGPQHFPMGKLLNTFEFLYECERVREHFKKNAIEHLRRLEHLAETFRGYKLPVIRVLDADLRQAVEIVTRLNTMGQPITADQFLSALAYGEQPGGETSFDLARSIDDLLEVLDQQGFGGVDRGVVLRALLAALEEDIYRTDWTRMFRERSDLLQRLPGAVDAVTESLHLATEFLHGLGVRSARLLPNALQIVVLSEFFRHCPEPSPVQRSLLERWFWVSSFTGWFASGNPSRTSRLIDEMRRAAKRRDASDLQSMSLSEAAQAFPRTFDARSARARAHMLVMLSLKPLRPDGTEAQEAWKLVAEKGARAFGYVVASPPPSLEEAELRSSPANRILNVGAERGQAKSWLLQLPSKLKPRARKRVLESHGISPEAFAALERSDTKAFLKQRLSDLMEIERQFMLARHVTPPHEREPQASPIDND